MTMEITEIPRAYLAPEMMRLRMHLPTASVPKGYLKLPPDAHIGGFNLSKRIPWIGEFGTTKSPNSAKNVRRTTIPREIQTEIA
jgi:hypothetical protein